MKVFSVKNPACWLILLLSGLTTIAVGWINTSVRNGIGLFEFRVQSLLWFEWGIYAVSSIVFWEVLYILFTLPICLKPHSIRRVIWGGVLWFGTFFIFMVNLFMLEALMGYPIYGFLIRTHLKPDILRNHEFVYLNYDSTPNQTKSKFYSTYQSGTGTFGIREDTFCEFDGVPFTVYYLTDNGSLTRLVLDTPPLLFQIPEYTITELNEIEPILGYRDENGKFIPCSPEEFSHDLQLGFKRIENPKTNP